MTRPIRQVLPDGALDATDRAILNALQEGFPLSPRPFDHTKAMTVDGAWSLVGSANWDPRSLRLNFELDVEAYDPELAARLDALVDARLRVARQLTLAEVDGRPLAVKLRDGVARLLSPYL